MQRMLLIVLSLLLTGPAAALIIDATDQERYERPPEQDPGWANVGRRGGTSAIYLGRGWVLSARHTGAGDVVFDGVTYQAVPDSMVQLVDPGKGDAKADLVLFRVDPAPPLPELRLREEPLYFGTLLTLIGYGHGRGEEIEWQGIAGFRWKPPPVKRWGTNRIFAVGIDVTSPDDKWLTRSFQMDFSQHGTPHEAQAAVGDSGGAVFTKALRGWELAGLLTSIGGLPDQDPKTALYGNTTNAADLSFYRTQIEEVIGVPRKPAAAGRQPRRNRR
jgi:hypothetical protein